MFWFVRIFVMLALAAVVVIGLGFLLPEERTAVKTTLIDAPLGRVYQIVTDVEEQTAWRSDVKTVHVERRGELWAWTEDQSTGTTFTLEETAKQPQQRYEFKYATSNGMRGTWLGEFESLNDDRTKLTLTRTVMIENPLRRVAAYILLNLDALMDVYLGDLNRYASQPETTLDPLLRPATPRPTPTVMGEEPVAKEPTVEPTPTADPTATPTVSPTATASPSPTLPLPIVPPSTVPPPSPVIAPPPVTPSPTSAVPIAIPTPTALPTSTSVILPSPTSLPPNTPSLLTPTATPLPAVTPTPTPTAATSTPQ